MKYLLMDILACPMCKHFPLKLIVIEKDVRSDHNLPWDKIPCEVYCGRLMKSVEKSKLDISICRECFKEEIVTGVLYCEKCQRWYPIIEEIPRMLPDQLRDERRNLAFLEKHREKLPEEIVKYGKPFNLG